MSLLAMSDIGYDAVRIPKLCQRCRSIISDGDKVLCLACRMRDKGLVLINENQFNNPDFQRSHEVGMYCDWCEIFVPKQEMNNRSEKCSHPHSTHAEMIDNDYAHKGHYVAKKTGPCFIATACYGGIYAPEVVALREFRDTRLLPTKIGHLFVNLYYKFSPPIANWLSRHQRIAGFVKIRILNPIVSVVRSRN